MKYSPLTIPKTGDTFDTRLSAVADEGKPNLGLVVRVWLGQNRVEYIVEEGCVNTAFRDSKKAYRTFNNLLKAR